MASRLQSAREAQARAEGKVIALEKDLGKLHEQVGPVADAAAEARRNAQIDRAMTRQRQRMLEDLVSHARAVGDRLGVEVPPLAAEGTNDEAGYVFFFERFLTELEETAKSLDERVVEASRDLLILATCRIFINLTRLHPSVDFKAVTAPVDVSCRTTAVQKAAEAYASLFDQVEEEESEDDGEEGPADEEERAAADDGGTSGGPQA